jgi:hypothetical protein
MPLDTQHWRFVGTIATTATTAAWLDGIHTLGNSTTYADGSTRTPGTGTAWVWSKQQVSGVTECVFGSMPYANPLNIRYTIAGSSTSRSYTILAPDTTSAFTNALLCSINRGVASSVGTWFDAAGLYGAGSSGYWRFGRANSGTAFDRISLYECEEQCMIVQSLSTTGASSIGGLFSLDPRDTGSPAAETDGRRWGMFCTGGTSNAGATGNFEYFPASAVGMFSHGTGAHVGHCGIFAVGSNTIVPVARMLTPGGSTAMNTGISTPNGKLPYSEDIPFNQGNSTVHGVWRGLAYTRKATSLTTWSDGGTVNGYFVGASTASAGDGVLLLRN